MSTSVPSTPKEAEYASDGSGWNGESVRIRVKLWFDFLTYTPRYPLGDCLVDPQEGEVYDWSGVACVKSNDECIMGPKGGLEADFRTKIHAIIYDEYYNGTTWLSAGKGEVKLYQHWKIVSNGITNKFNNPASYQPSVAPLNKTTETDDISLDNGISENRWAGGVNVSVKYKDDHNLIVDSKAACEAYVNPQDPPTWDNIGFLSTPTTNPPYPVLDGVTGKFSIDETATLCLQLKPGNCTTP